MTFGPWPRLCCLVTPAPLGTVGMQGRELVQENTILLLEAKKSECQSTGCMGGWGPCFFATFQASNL